MNKESIRRFEDLLKSKFEINNLGNVQYYIGLEIERDCFVIFSMKQEQYIKKVLNDFNMFNSKKSDYPLSPGYGKLNQNEILFDNKQYQKVIGCLLCYHFTT